eukprot:10368944-Ditylum_brightwellii.AAC.1
MRTTPIKTTTRKRKCKKRHQDSLPSVTTHFSPSTKRKIPPRHSSSPRQDTQQRNVRQKQEYSNELGGPPDSPRKLSQTTLWESHHAFNTLNLDLFDP